MRKIAIVLAVLGAAACASYDDTRPVYSTSPAVVDYGTLVRCESINNTRETCKADARGRMVVVNQQLSKNPCIIGRTWGVSSDRDEIWVNDGCRAEFQVGGNTVATTAFARSVICESQNNSKERCPVDTSYGVQLARQISSSECVRGDDWGFDENGIWVDNGCRAEFVLGGDTRFTPMVSSSRAVVLCESQNMATKHCPADTFFGVTLERQISDSTCIRGRTWGYDPNGIWVSGGCRAEFVIGQ